MPGLRDLASAPGELVPLRFVRRSGWLPGRRLLLRLGNDRLRRFPRSFAEADTTVGRIVDGNTADLIERYLFVFGTWEPSLTELLRSRLGPGDVFVDVGANIGYFTLLAARLVGEDGHVVAFEALPATVSKLRRNIAANDLSNVTVVPAAAGDEAGTVEMFAAPGTNVGKSSTLPVAGGLPAGRIERVVAADAIPHDLWQRVRAIKVDVEGDELHVLRGLRPVLDAMAPGACVVAEVAPERLAARGSSSAEVLDLMSAAGFAAAAIDNDYHPRRYVRDVEVVLEPLVVPPARDTDVVFTKLDA